MKITIVKSVAIIGIVALNVALALTGNVDASFVALLSLVAICTIAKQKE